MRRLLPLSADDRRRHGAEAVRLFNGGRFWEAHEALEVIWRSLADPDEARVVQGLIQAAAALLHQSRGNLHGTKVVGEAALDKLRGPQHPAVEFETVVFRRGLEAALTGEGPVPKLEVRGHER